MTKDVQRSGLRSTTADPIRTGTRCPSRCTYSFSNGWHAPVRRNCSMALASAPAHLGGVIFRQSTRPASSSSLL